VGAPMNADERQWKTLYVIHVHGSSSAALTDFFTSSSPLAILSFISEIDGVVKFGEVAKGQRKIYVTADNGEEKEYSVTPRCLYVARLCLCLRVVPLDGCPMFAPAKPGHYRG
jgi:hypothetical protein